MSSPSLASSLAGSLAKNGTPRLFYWLLQQRFTGQVHLRELPAMPDATIYVHEGVPWFSDLVHNPSLLGELLLISRKITQEDLHQALMQMAQSGQLLGHILVAQGKLNAAQLGQALSYQCLHKLVHLFSLRSGSVQLEPQEKLQGLKAGLTQGVNSLGLIMQGVRRHWDQARIDELWGQSKGQVLRTTSAFLPYRDHFGLNEQELLAADKLAKGWSLGSAPLHEAQLAFVLWNCGMLERSSRVQTLPPKLRKSPPAQAPATPKTASPAPKKAAAAGPKLPVARSGRPKTEVPIRAKTGRNRKTNSRFQRLPPGMVPKSAANQSKAKDPKAREVFIANLETYESLIAREVHAFALFDLPLTATRADVRKQWNRLSRDFHPDALPKLELESMHTRSQRVFAHLSNAYQILSNKERRNALKAKLESGIAPGQDTADFVRQSLESESLIKDAERLLKKHQYKRAQELLHKADELRKDQGDVLAGLAWCEYQLSGRDEAASKSAITQLRSVAKAHPKCANAFYYLGLVFAAHQERGSARKAFADAIEINPRFLEAQRQLRALEATAAAAPERSKKKKFFGR